MNALTSPEAAAKAQEVDVHRPGNLTITACNKSFVDKRDRTDSQRARASVGPSSNPGNCTPIRTRTHETYQRPGWSRSGRADAREGAVKSCLVSTAYRARPILRALVPRMLILDGSFLDLTDLDQCRDRIFEVAAIPRCQRAPQLGTRDPVTSVVLAVVHQDRALGFRLTASHEPSCLAAFSS